MTPELEKEIKKRAADKYPEGGLYYSASDHNRIVNQRKGYIACAIEYEPKLLQAQQLLLEVVSRHEAGLLPDRFIYDKIKEFLK
jgi:hypothetical protein